MEQLQKPVENEVLRPNFSFRPPLGVELFIAGQGANTELSQEISSDLKLRQESCLRAKLINNLRTIFDEFDSGSRPDLSTVYSELTGFIEADTNNARIILYLPTELLPNMNVAKSKPAEKLAKAVRDNWIMLLFESELRASFSDGDVLEPGMGEPPRARKAAHLIPILLEKGIVTSRDLSMLIDVTSDEELLTSISEGTLVGMDNGLLDEKLIEKIQKMPQPRKMVPNISLAHVSPERVKWLESVKKDQEIQDLAKQVSESLRNGTFHLENVEKLSPATLKGIFLAAENDPEKAYEIISNYGSLIESAWKYGSIEEKDIIVEGLNHWSRLGILSEKFLQDLGVEKPDLSQPIPIDFNKFIHNEAKQILEVTRIIADDTELSKYLYPIVLVFGSRLKGYSTLSADLDGAVFFKPSAQMNNKEEILDRLKKITPVASLIDKIVDFWPTQNNIASSSQVHFLMGGIWIGEINQIDKLSNELLRTCLDLSRFGQEKEEVRRKSLRKLELDVLHFRLLHKGYRRFYPVEKRTATKNSDLIDWQSDFWDKGYRRTATLLFLSRVFLPNLSL